MNFKTWLVTEDGKGYNYYKNLVLGKLNLDHNLGVSQQLNTWEPEQLSNELNGLGEFTSLPQQTQQQVLAQIQSRNGTIGDLIHIMAAGSF